jgi:SNF2 family DNA or RNA helicase
MPVSHIIRPDCPKCGKPAKEKSSFVAVLPKQVNGEMKPQRTKIILLECGHTITEEKLEKISFDGFTNVDGSKTLFPFQAEACRRAVEANFKVLLRLDMGLGKTIISSILLRHYWKDLTPALIICKASMTEQWMMELLDWCPDRLVQVLETSRETPCKGIKLFIASQDLLAPRYNRRERVEKGGLPWLRDYPLKTIIYDEVQHIKNPDAARTRFVQDLAAKTERFIALSGTPIKNNAGEYFNILNILDPINFRYRQVFFDQFIHYYNDDNGRLRIGGLKQRSYERFKQLTAPFIIEYDREVVMPQLPQIFRQRRFFHLDEEVNKAYKKELGNFFDIYDGDNEEGAWAKQRALGQSLMKMYHMVGFAKVEPIVDYVTQWLEEHDEEKDLLAYGNGDGKEIKLRAKPKIVIFIHHIDVGTTIESRLNQVLGERGDAPCSRLLGGLSGEQSSLIEKDFRDNPKRRVLVASTLAAGEGKNFQFCSDAVMGERQWNPPNEYQAECRFPRPGSTASQVNVLYPTAIGTFDEYQAELVEKKRAYLATVKGKWSDYTESEFMKDLIQKLATEGRAKWRGM